jgi:hypothetical protein
MRSRDLKHLASLEADQLASDAFDAYGADIESWVRDAFVGEWDKNAAREVVRAAIRVFVLRHDTPLAADAVRVLRTCVGNLHDAYVEHASQAGLYAATAYDNVCAQREEYDEAQAELRAEIRAQEAHDAGIRG